MARKVDKGRVNQRQRLAALLISSGVTQKDAAKVLGVDENTVSRWKKQKAFKELLAQRMQEAENEVAKARDILIEGAVLAALKELGSLDSEDEGIALRAADAILDRVGIGRTSKIEQVADKVIKLRWIDGDSDDRRRVAATSSGATGNIPESSEVQGSSSREEIRQDKAGGN